MERALSNKEGIVQEYSDARGKLHPAEVPRLRWVVRKCNKGREEALPVGALTNDDEPDWERVLPHCCVIAQVWRGVRQVLAFKLHPSTIHCIPRTRSSGTFIILEDTAATDSITPRGHRWLRRTSGAHGLGPALL